MAEKTKSPLQFGRLGANIELWKIRRLKSVLALRGKTITEWVKEKVDKEIEEE